MKPSIRGFLLASAFLAPLLATEARSETPKQMIVRCLDAAQQAPSPCTVSVVPPATQGQAGTSVTLDLTGPTIQLEIKADGYGTRAVEINAASRKDRVPRIEVYLARDLAGGALPTLGMVNAAKAGIQNGQIDKALAIIEQIGAAKPNLREGSTFHTRYLYWRASGLYRGCTVLFYYTCDSAKEAINDLLDAIGRNPDDFAREGITAKALSQYPLELEVAAFRNMLARAKWYLEEGKFEEALEEYATAKTEFDAGTPEFRKKTRVTSQTLDDNVKYVETKIRIGGNAVDADQGAQQTP